MTLSEQNCTRITRTKFLARPGEWTPEWRPTKRPPFMTLIVGIIAQDAIVFGADSQTTYGDTKLLDTKKLHVLEFQNTTAIVAESGGVSGAMRAMEKLRKHAPDTNIETEDDAVAFLTSFVERVKIHSLACTLMFGMFVRKRPVIIFFDSFEGETIHRKGYVVSGVGCEVSRFVLHQALKQGELMNPTVAVAFAVHAVTQGSEHSILVGGATQITTLTRFTNPSDPTWEHIADEEWPASRIDWITPIVRDAGEQMRSLIQERLEKRFQEHMGALFSRGDKDSARPMPKAVRKILGRDDEKE